MPKPLPNPRKSYEHKEQTMNEPVGVVCEFEGTLVGTLFEQLPNGTKLYTHPVKEHDRGISHAIGFDDGFKAGMQRAVEMNVVKELTDEEIWEVVSLKWWDWEDSFDVTGFARAILRKAQEK